jgi:quinol-cytochrome oxidoreductase complex cytochrome b subunit
MSIPYKVLDNPVIDWLDERFQVKELIRAGAADKPRALKGWAGYLGCFGGLSALLFGVQLVTGLLLISQYKPAPELAFPSVMAIEGSLPGLLIRRIHAAGANLMLLFIFIHMARVLVAGAYKKPRELHWVSGCLLFLMALAMKATGDLLPWTRSAFWSTAAACSWLDSAPVVGEGLSSLIRGGCAMGPATLGRFYAAHLVLPFLALVGMGLHFAMVRRTGISEPL